MQVHFFEFYFYILGLFSSQSVTLCFWQYSNVFGSWKVKTSLWTNSSTHLAVRNLNWDRTMGSPTAYGMQLTVYAIQASPSNITSGIRAKWDVVHAPQRPSGTHKHKHSPASHETIVSPYSVNESQHNSTSSVHRWHRDSAQHNTWYYRWRRSINSNSIRICRREWQASYLSLSVIVALVRDQGNDD